VNRFRQALLKTDAFNLAKRKTTIMENLTPVLSKYIQTAKRLTEMNADIAEVRDIKRTLELDLAAVYATNTLPDKIELRESKMTFAVKRPNQWKKGWTLSKKTLETYLRDILGDKGQEVMKEIVRRHEPTLTEDDFGFELKSMDH
jgi:hypothetical protein